MHFIRFHNVWYVHPGEAAKPLSYDRHLHINSTSKLFKDLLEPGLKNNHLHMNETNVFLK